MGILSSLLSSALGQSPASAQMSSSTPPPATTTTTTTTTIPVQPTPTTPIARQPAAAAAAAQSLDDDHHQPREFPPVFSTRSLRQLGLFMGGAGFLVFSVLVSRRAVIRHTAKAPRPKFYQPNHASSAATRLKEQQETTTGRDPLVAVEALNLATLNVVSFFVMALGGASWAFDISSLDDLRRMARRSIHGAAAGDGGGHHSPDEEAEREVAAWVAKYMGKDKVAKLLKEEGGGGGKQDES